MRIQRIFALAAMMTGLAGVARAQDTSSKPGGLNKAAHAVSKASKAAGRDVKETAKKAGSATHHALKTTGNATKDEAKKATGYTSPKYDSTHKPGGVNKVARDISSTSKKAGSDVKHAVKKTGSKTHEELTDAGKATKDSLKKVKPPTK